MTVAGAAWGAQEQVQVTDWPQRLGLTALMLAVIGLALWGMWRGWNRRAARQSWVPALPPWPQGAQVDQVWPARYVATVATEDWLDRIVAQGLGAPGNATVAVGEPGVLIRRDGAGEVAIGWPLVESASVARGMAQEVYERDGLLVLTWWLGGRSVSTGLRMADAAAQSELLAVLQDHQRQEGSV